MCVKSHKHHLSEVGFQAFCDRCKLILIEDRKTTTQVLGRYSGEICSNYYALFACVLQKVVKLRQNGADHHQVPRLCTKVFGGPFWKRGQQSGAKLNRVIKKQHWSPLSIRYRYLGKKSPSIASQVDKIPIGDF